MLKYSKSRWRDLDPRPIPYQGIALPGCATAASSTAPEYQPIFYAFRLIQPKDNVPQITR